MTVNLTQKPSRGGTPAIVAMPVLIQKTLVGKWAYSCRSVRYFMLRLLKLSRELNSVTAARKYVMLYRLALAPTSISIKVAA